MHNQIDSRWARHHLYLQTVPGKGTGVFCKEFIKEGELIELCPTIKVPVEHSKAVQDCILDKYFYVRKDHGVSAVLGFGMLYNHSYCPNANFVWDSEENWVEIVALKDIEPGHEIVFNYWGDPACQDPMWFENVVDEKRP